MRLCYIYWFNTASSKDTLYILNLLEDLQKGLYEITIEIMDSNLVEGIFMSLNIYVHNSDFTDNSNFVKDVELAFKSIKIQRSSFNVDAIRTIDKGVYNDSTSFIDRFGFKLYLDDLSTGCKAAICANSLPDAVVNTIECGINALSFIVTNCKSGNILVSNESLIFTGESSAIIDVVFNGVKFNSLGDLNNYLKEY